MARTDITRDQVFEEADALVGGGIQPTVKLVRERIGGSYWPFHSNGKIFYGRNYSENVRFQRNLS